MVRVGAVIMSRNCWKYEQGLLVVRVETVSGTSRGCWKYEKGLLVVRVGAVGGTSRGCLWYE